MILSKPCKGITITLNILALIAFMVVYSGASIPWIGHDYRLFIPRLLDTYLHYKINGLTIQWYTPSFGGGLPAYPNPLQMQFSLTQLLTWFFNPWVAVMASAGIYIVIGFVVAYLFMKNLLGLKPLSAILGSIFFSANGFMIERLVVGHVNFITFPLVIIFIFALLHPKIPAWLAGGMIALTAAILVYTGGVYIGVIAVFSVLIILPLVYFMEPALFSWRRFLPVVLWAVLLGCLLCGSKWYATAEYMKNFPRTASDNFATSVVQGLEGMTLQLIGPTTTLPVLKLLGKSYESFTLRLEQWTGTPYGFWELDSGMMPGVFLLLLIGFYLMVFHRHRWNGKKLLTKVFWMIFLMLAVLLVSSFATTKGFMYHQLRVLPVLESLHANTRFTAAFILPLAVLAAKAFDVWTRNWKSIRTTLLVFILIDVISMASLWSYYLMPLEIQFRAAELPFMVTTWEEISARETFPVKNIVPDMNDYEVIMFQSSNVTHHYDPLFGNGSVLLKPMVHAGSVFEIQDGYYNMTNPSSLVFPQSDTTTLFERIPISETKELVDFINRQQPDWEIPPVQIVLNWAAGFTFILLLVAISIFLVQRWLLKRFLRMPGNFLRRLTSRR